jgi:hypothetical protein
VYPKAGDPMRMKVTLPSLSANYWHPRNTPEHYYDSVLDLDRLIEWMRDRCGVEMNDAAQKEARQLMALLKAFRDQPPSTFGEFLERVPPLTTEFQNTRWGGGSTNFGPSLLKHALLPSVLVALPILGLLMGLIDARGQRLARERSGGVPSGPDERALRRVRLGALPPDIRSTALMRFVFTSFAFLAVAGFLVWAAISQPVMTRHDYRVMLQSTSGALRQVEMRFSFETCAWRGAQYDVQAPRFPVHLTFALADGSTRDLEIGIPGAQMRYVPRSGGALRVVTLDREELQTWMSAEAGLDIKDSNVAQQAASLADLIKWNESSTPPSIEVFRPKVERMAGFNASGWKPAASSAVASSVWPVVLLGALVFALYVQSFTWIKWSAVREAVQRGELAGPPAVTASPATERAGEIQSAGLLMTIAGIAIALSGFIAFIYGAVMAFSFAHQTGNPGDAAARAAGGAFLMLTQALGGVAVLVGGLSMRKVRFHGYALAISVLLMALLPATLLVMGKMHQIEWVFFQQAFGVYAGIRAFRLLRKPEVEAAFGGAADASPAGREASPDSSMAKFLRSILWLVVFAGGVMFCWFDAGMSFRNPEDGGTVTTVTLGAVQPWLTVVSQGARGHSISPNFLTVSALVGLCAAVAGIALHSTRSCDPGGSGGSGLAIPLILVGAALAAAGLIDYLVSADQAIAQGVMDFQRADRPQIKSSALMYATRATMMFLAGVAALCGGVVLRQRRSAGDGEPAALKRLTSTTGALAAAILLFYGISAQMHRSVPRLDFLALPLVVVAATGAAVLLARSSARGRPASADALPETVLAGLGITSAAMPWDSFAITSGNPWDMLGSGWGTNHGTLFSLIYLALGIVLLVSGGTKRRPAWRSVAMMTFGLTAFVVAFHFTNHHAVPQQLGWRPPGEPPATYHLQTGLFVSFALALLTVLLGAIQLRNRVDPGEPLATQTSDEPRLSKCALIGAIWAPCVLNGWWAWQLCLRQYFDDPARFASYSGGYLALGITAAILAMTAPFGATILGGVAMAKIKRSGGKLYGLPLAAAALLFQPLVALGLFAAYVLKPHALSFLFRGASHYSPNEVADMRARLGDALGFSSFDFGVVLAVCGLAGWLAWRKIAATKAGTLG